MPRIKIKHFGPIKEGCLDNDGWIEIKQITAFLGNQGSGKSTVAKLISTFYWIEKDLVRNGSVTSWHTQDNRFINTFLPYHKLEYYLSDKTEIEFQGDAYDISFKDNKLIYSEKKESNYELPQIMYVPAERNFISYLRKPKELKLSSGALQEFLTEFENSKQAMETESFRLPINDTKIHYDRLNDNLNISGSNYKIRLSHASSGFHSLVPLFLVTRFLSRSVMQSQSHKDFVSIEESAKFKKEMELILSDNNMNETQRRIAISVLSSRFNKRAFINIVEEPEQNLFPESQWKLLRSLLEFNMESPGNKLIFATHSPYLISYLSLLSQAGTLKFKDLKDKHIEEIDKIVPIKAAFPSEYTAIYELDEKDGTIRKLEDYEGIPTDENYLNKTLRKGNEMFDRLLDIEEGL